VSSTITSMKVGIFLMGGLRISRNFLIKVLIV
jgi:hypothetical protein